MRVPNEAALSTASPIRRYQLWLLIAIVVIIVLLVAVQGIADLFTNYLWYRSVRADDVWRTMTATKLELFVFFTAVFFVACWTSLLIVDRVAPRALFMSPEQEFVRRYQTLVGRHRFAVRTIVSLFFALIFGNGTTSQWQHWLLFLRRELRRKGPVVPQEHRLLRLQAALPVVPRGLDAGGADRPGDRVCGGVLHERRIAFLRAVAVGRSRGRRRTSRSSSPPSPSYGQPVTSTSAATPSSSRRTPSFREPITPTYTCACPPSTCWRSWR